MAKVDIEISKSYGSDTNIVIESNNEDGSNKLIPKFGVTAEQLLEIIGDRDSKGVINRLDQSGGLKQLSFNLETDLVNGLPSADNLKNREAYFGSNIIPKDKGRTIFTMIFEAATDRLLIVLTICAFASIVLNVAFSPAEEKAFSWIDGAAIFAAVLIVISVGVGNDWTKERQFQALNKKLDLSEPCTVIRGGESYEIPQIEILVGDVVSVKAGDRIPADGLLIRSNELRIDQSGLTGESVQIGKSLTKDIILYGSTEVREGTGTMLVIAVGHNSENGRIVALLRGGRKQKKKQEKSGTSNNVGNKEKIDDNDENKNSNWKEKLNIRQRVRQYKIKKEEEEEIQVQSPLQQTILQKKLTRIAAYIGYFGLVAGVLTSLVLIIQHFVAVRSWNSGRDLLRLVEILSIGITVLVVAIPEGLPLAVAISLSFSVRKMLKDHNLVRKFYSCETMGNATTICSDKTGTLTQNRMSVVKSYFNFTETPNTPAVTGNTKDVLLSLCSVCSNYDSKIVPAKEEIASDSKGIWSRLKKSFSSIKMPDISRSKGKVDFTQTELEIKKALPEQQGNKTECALLQMVLDLGGNYESIRNQYPIDDRVKTLEFSSERKSMSVVINTTNSQGEEVYRIFTKGASERVLDMCEYIIDEEGQVVKLTEEHRAKMQEYITKFAGLALRTLLLAYRDIVKHPEGAKVIPLIIWDDSEFVQSLTCIGIVGIQDPLREEVVGSIELCKRAGITVRMITGDNVDTARAIALNCGIITSEDSEEAVMDSKEFNRRVRKAVNGKVSRNRLDEVWPTLRVLARSSPTDKYVLVDGIIKSKLNNQRQIVAVTGDGTNDGPALQRADVGFAMGIAGTAVAKGACDIILTDDNFASIVKAVMWGRNVYDSISKFLQFQLTVNVVAVTVAFISAIFNRTPLTVVQLLWVNIIMDSLASLALATEDPIPALLERKPYGRSKPLITRLIFRFIFFHSLLQLFIILSLFGAGHLLFDIPEGNNEEPTQHYTIVFNTFVLLQLVNEVNARKIHGEGNVFKGIFNNWIFWAIIIVSVLVQILVIECGLIWPPLQRVFQTNPLTFEQWLWCIFFALFELIFNQLILLYPVFLVPRLGWFTKWLKYLKCWGKKRGKEAISIAAHDEDEGLSLEPANPKELWILGIKKITTQIRVVNAFRDSIAIPQSLQDQIDTDPSEPPTPMLVNNSLRTNLF